MMVFMEGKESEKARKMKNQICQTIIDEETGKICGHPKEYHVDHNLSCNALKCPCEKYTPQNCECCHIDCPICNPPQNQSPQSCREDTPSGTTSQGIQPEKPEGTQAQGCGKKVILGQGKYDYYDCDGRDFLCPECQNQSPDSSVETPHKKQNQDKPEAVALGSPSGTQVQENIPLSDKIFSHYIWYEKSKQKTKVILAKDVKNSIKKLKEVQWNDHCIYHELGEEDRFCVRCLERKNAIRRIDKLAGEELTG